MFRAAQIRRRLVHRGVGHAEPDVSTKVDILAIPLRKDPGHVCCT